MIHIGCCGFPKAHGQYYQNLSAVEVQQTFYQVPKIMTAERWRREAPPHFVFTMKAWQLITHPAESPTYQRLKRPIPPHRKRAVGFFQSSPEVYQAFKESLAFARALRAEVTLLQCPTRFAPTPINKAALTEFLKRMGKPPLRIALEVRGPWTREDVKPFVEQFSILHAVDPLTQTSCSWDPFYYRLHGRGGYTHRYSDEDLKELVRIIGNRTCGYVFFNNVHMWEDAQRFLRLITP